MLKTYLITRKAGRFVAGQRNPGVGLPLTLTDKQAEHDLAQGTIVLKREEAKATPEAAPATGKPAPETEPAVTDEMTVKAILAYADENEIEVEDRAAKKADLIEEVNTKAAAKTAGE